MYGRMQFADFVVSWALQSLSRSLQKVAPRSGELRCSDQRFLAQTAERIFSLWQMAQWSVSKLEFKRARADLQAIVLLTTADRSPERQAAERLIERADPKSRRLLEDLLATRPTWAPGGEDRRDRLNELLQAESLRWRTYTPLRLVVESELVDHGMLRAFDKARTLSERLDAMAADPDNRAGLKRLARTGRWTRHCVNHLELLRPALSDVGRTRRWHLTRLAAKLDEQWSLEKLAGILAAELKPKAAKRVVRLLADERKRLDKQRRKLTIGAFAGGGPAYRTEVTEAVAKLGLDAIVLLPMDNRHESGNHRINDKEIG